MWQHPPTPDALLDARLAAGWRPTVTMLKTGPVVEGHAAKVPRQDWIMDGAVCGLPPRGA